MSILDIVFPRYCLECRSSGRYICPVCLVQVSIPKLICPVCQKPSIRGLTHMACNKGFVPDRLISLWKYEGVIRKAILALKYKFASDVAEEIAGVSVSSLVNFKLPEKTVLVPIPLYPRRENWRGFNQSQEIGKRIASELGWRIEPDLIRRNHETKSQAELKRRVDRLENLSGAFDIGKEIDSRSIDTFILFDDVYTTGATLLEAARILKVRYPDIETIGVTIAR